VGCAAHTNSMRIAVLCVLLLAMGPVLATPCRSVCETMLKFDFLLEVVTLALFLVCYSGVTTGRTTHVKQLIAKTRVISRLVSDGGYPVIPVVLTAGCASPKGLYVFHGSAKCSGNHLRNDCQTLKSMNVFDPAQRKGMARKAPEFSEMMYACIRSGSVAQALELIDQMFEMGPSPDAHLIGKGVSDRFFKLVLENAPDDRIQKHGLQLLDLIRAHGISPSFPMQNRLVAAWKSKLPENVLHYFVKMKSDGVVLARIVYHCILMAYERRDPEFTLQMFDEMETLGIKPDSVAYNAVLGACAQLGMHEETRQLFMNMSDRGLVPDRKSYSIMLRVHIASDQPKAPVAIMETMRKQGLDPDSNTYHHAIVSCVKLQRIEHAIELHNDMVQARVVPYDSTCAFLRSASHNVELGSQM